MPKNNKPSCLNDYRPVALTSIVMKVFERLVKSHISSSVPVTLDPLQFAYRPNRYTDDAISHILHSSLTHIDSNNGNFARLLFIDYSSAFNTIVPIKLSSKLTDLSLNSSLCDWIQDFLTGRPQVVKVGQFTSNSIILNVGAPQGCVLSPLLYSLYTHDCVSSHSSTSIIKFADDTVVLGLISNNDETAYLDEVERLTSWCQDNCLFLNVSKTKELIVDFRKPFSWRHMSVVTLDALTPASVHSLWSSHTCLNQLCLTVFSSLQSSLLLVHLFLPNSSFQSTLHLICFDTALCKQPHLSVMTLCDLPSLWRASMFIFWTIAKSAVFSITVVSKNKRYPEFIL